MNRAWLPLLAALMVFGLGRPASANEQSPYGVCVHLPSDATLAQVEQAGIDWIRVDFNWILMEPSRGVFDWRVTDRVVRDATARGLHVFATLAYSPGWANGGQHHSAPPLDVADWARFVAAVVGRYKDRVKHWGMWNEPNLSHFFSGSRDDYLAILREGAHAAKSVDPACLILGPDLSHWDGWQGWMKDILRRGGSHIDIITHHIYKGPPRKTFRLLDGWTWPWEGSWPYGTVQQVIRRNGGAGKPVWITEIGWRTSGNERQQADYLRDFMQRFSSRSWLEKVFVYEIVDGPGINEWGLIRSDGSPKLAYTAYQDFIRSHPPLVIPPPAPPGTTWTFEAEALPHGIGRREADGWSASTPLDGRGHLSFGPYTTVIPPGTRTASFRLMLDNVTATNHGVVTLDVYDATAGSVLAQRTVTRHEFGQPFVYQEISLPFTAPGGHSLEFRTYWLDTSYVRQDRVEVR